MTKICHENDLEGSIITVEKYMGGRFGKIRYVEALAHFLIKGAANPYFYIGNSHHLGGITKRPFLRVEAGGHGVHLWNGNYPKQYNLYLPSDDTSKPKIDKVPVYYELRPLSELWNLRRNDPIDLTFHGTLHFEGERFSIPNLPASLAGKKFGVGLATMPWAWSAKGATKGEWFLDPALWVSRKILNPKNFSLDYIYHPYLDATDLRE